jgi:hypothetical protein
MKKNLHVRVKPLFCIIFLLISILQINNAFAQPANNNCASGGAVLLTSAVTCSSPTTGTVINATATTGVPMGTCTGNPNDDVWYRFVAVSNEHMISLSGIGSNLAASGANLQIFSGTCGALTSIGCGITTLYINTLTVGTTYYVRVYSGGGTAITSNGGFSICVTHGIIDFGKSYINISKPASGTVETGDVLEIRASVVVRAGSYDSCRFTDNIPTGTTYVPGTLRILTNEGKQYKLFTDNQFDVTNSDQGWISGTTVTMNLGNNPTDNQATVNRRGRLASNHRPSNFGATCILLATYRVTVTAPIGSIINTGGGNVTYGLLPGPINTFTFPSNPVAVYTNFGMCANSIGANSIGTEFNGTFGSGPTRNRGTSGNVPAGYTYSIFYDSGPNDYFYGIANNTSTVNAYTTSNAWAKPDPVNPTRRVFRVWDIIGDHTGATNQFLGNPAADTVANNNRGYMLVVNAAYRIDSAFQQTISNLCPNTYYEISCWMRNICSKCSSDSAGRGPTSSGYIPTAPGDSSGITPNVTFEVDGIDYYSTGNLGYTGLWVKRGFTILTGPAQTSFVLKFFNNAPGGGGNDWALDDISVATCLPNMRYSPSLTPNVCNNNALTIYDTVRSYFNNYVYYKWQRSTNGGVSWTDVSTPFGPVVPTWNATLSAWQYVSSYTVPPTATFPANSGDKYRLIVATTVTNLSNINCSSTDATNTITMNVITCGPVLGVDITSFRAVSNNNRATLEWSTAGEAEALYFDIERSYDGVNFTAIGTINNEVNYNGEADNYTFTDPDDITTKAFYRIRMRSQDNRSVYSRTLQVANSRIDKFSFGAVISPFTNTLYFDISSTEGGLVRAELVNHLGQPVRRKSMDIRDGMSQFTFENTGTLPAGVYILKAEMKGVVIYRKVMKQN